MISDSIQKNILTATQQETNYKHYQLYELELLVNIFDILHPQTVFSAGGFSNLDFFIAQSNCNSVQQTVNVDCTPYNNFVKQRHYVYKKMFNYKGEYKFINQEFKTEKFCNKYDVIWDQIPGLSGIAAQSTDHIENCNTFILTHYHNAISKHLINTIAKTKPLRIISATFCVFHQDPIHTKVSNLVDNNKHRIYNFDSYVCIDKTSEWNETIGNHLKENK